MCSGGKTGTSQALKVPCLCLSWPTRPLLNQSVRCESLFPTILVLPASQVCCTRTSGQARASQAAGRAHLVSLLLDLFQLGQHGGHAVLVQVTVLLQCAMLQPQVLHLLQVLWSGGQAEWCRVETAQVRPQGWGPGEANQQVPSRSTERGLSPNNKCPPPRLGLTVPH